MIDFQPRGSSLAISNANRQKRQSTQNLSSGSRKNIRLKDPGSFSMNVRLQWNAAMGNHFAQNMHVLIFYGQPHDGVQENIGQLVPRVTALASLSTNTRQSREYRSSYQRELLGLVDQFESLQADSFNGLRLLENGYGEEKHEFVDSLKNSSLKASEGLIKDEYGWYPGTYVVVEVNGPTGGSAAFVRSSYATTGPDAFKADVKTMSFDVPDFTVPNTQSQSTNDGVVVHEMVHLLQAQNSYFEDLTGGGFHKCVTRTAIGFADSDTRFIAGSDVFGSPVDEKTSRTVIPDANGTPQGNYIEEEAGKAITFLYSGGGEASILTPAPSISFGDTATYNLSTIQSAKQTLKYLKVLTQSIAGSRSTAGSDMTITQNGLEALLNRTNTLNRSISRAQDASFAEESVSFTKPTLILSFSLSMSTQARQTSASRRRHSLS